MSEVKTKTWELWYDITKNPNGQIYLPLSYSKGLFYWVTPVAFIWYKNRGCRVFVWWIEHNIYINLQHPDKHHHYNHYNIMEPIHNNDLLTPQNDSLLCIYYLGPSAVPDLDLSKSDFTLSHNSGVQSSITTHTIVEPIKTVRFPPCCNMLCNTLAIITLANRKLTVTNWLVYNTKG